MKKLLIIVIATWVSFITGCATGITKEQNIELELYKQRDLAVIVDRPGLAISLGFLFGAGSFYTGNPGLGILNLLTWPASILWDPISGLNGAKANNYAATKAHVKILYVKEQDNLTTKLELKEINQEEFDRRSRDLKRKYLINLVPDSKNLRKNMDISIYDGSHRPFSFGTP